MENLVRIVIADDQLPARLGLRSLLSLVPQITVAGEANNGQEALLLVAQKQPDVILMDIEMPVMDGIEATREIKQQWPTTSVIGISVHPKYRAATIAAGADGFLLKGASCELLLSTILGSANRTDCMSHL